MRDYVNLEEINSIIPAYPLTYVKEEENAFMCGFRYLKNIINTLHRVDIDDTYNRGLSDGLSDAWEAAHGLVEMCYDKSHDVYDVLPEFKKYSPKKAIEAVKAYKESKKLKVGDEIEYCCTTAVVTQVDGESAVLLYKSGKSITINKNAAIRHKTGRNVKMVQDLLTVIGGSEE